MLINMKNNKGFGIIQILITLVVLAFVGAFAFKSYVGNTQTAVKTGVEESRKVKELEGKLFLASVVRAEKTHHALNSSYVYTGWTASNAQLGISTAGNKYFKEFAVEKTPSGGFIVKVKGSGEMEGVELTADNS